MKLSDYLEQSYDMPTGMLGAIQNAETGHISGDTNAATSPKGAQGRFQIMPGTARDLGVDPRDPVQAMIGAAGYLRSNYDNLGRWDLAVAGYNAGPNRDSLRAGRIPAIKETQDYVAKVMSRLGRAIIPSAEAATPATMKLSDVMPAAEPAQTMTLSDAQQLAAQTMKLSDVMPQGNIGDAILDAATFGLSDEAKASGAAVGDWIARQLGSASTTGTFSGDYDRALAAERAKLDSLSTVERLAGGLVGGLAAAPRAAAQALSGIPKWAGLMGQGAAAGGVYGFNSGESGALDRAESAVTGGALGGAIAGAAPAIAGAGRAALQTFTQPGAASARRAADIVERALIRDNATAAGLPQGMLASGPGAVVAEGAGDSTRRLARAVANTPGESGQLASRVLEPRSQRMGEDVTRAARGALGDTNAYDAIDALTARQRAAASPVYEAAYQQPMQFSGTLEDLMNRPATRKALKRAWEIADNRGDNLPQWFVKLSEKDGRITAADFEEVPSTRVWHYVRQALDDQLEGYRDKTSGRLALDSMGNSIKGIRDSLDKEMKSQNQLLKDADRLFAGDAKAKDAVAKGREFMRRRPEEIDRAMARMTDSEREFYRLGVAQSLDDRMNDVARGNSVLGRLADVPNFEAKVRAIFPDKAQADEFISLLTNKRAQQEFRNMVLRGSRTAPLAEDVRDLGTGRLETALDAARLARGESGAAARLLTKAADRWRAGFSERTRDNIGRMLFTEDPRVLQQTLSARSKQRAINMGLLGGLVMGPAMEARPVLLDQSYSSQPPYLMR